MVCLPEEKASVYTEAFFGLLEEVTFDGIGQFGFEGFFPNSVQLAGDGFGNFWILSISSRQFCYCRLTKPIKSKWLFMGQIWVKY